MLIFRLSGGFGNQLWSYAAAYSLARERGAKFAMDTSTQEAAWFFRDYLLKHYRIHMDKKICYRLGDGKLDHLLFNHIHRRLSIGLFTPTVYEKDHSAYDPSVFEKPYKTAYYIGDWQRLMYFQKYEADIRRMYVYQEELSAPAKEWLLKIRGCNSVAVHVRRGDYIRIGIALGESYYRGAVELLAGQLKEPAFFCFSEDLDWVRKAFADLPYTFHYVDFDAPLKDLEDFELMRACSHQIISRSTYSWWAAFLNDHKDKQVVFPDDGSEKDRITWSKDWQFVPPG